MILWKLPSTAPRDGGSFALRTSSGDLETCRFDTGGSGDFIIASIINPYKRRSPTLIGYVGWTKWSDVFAHVRDTTHKVDTQELTAARNEADATVHLLKMLARKSCHEDQKALALETVETIERLLKLLPPRD